MHFLMKMPDKPIDTKVIQSLMARVKTDEARKGIQLADQLSDMILFHTRVLENGKKMEQAWDSDSIIFCIYKGNQLIFSGIHCIIAM